MVTRYWSIPAGILALFLTTYLLVEALDVALLTDPQTSLREGGATGAGLGVLLLVADQFVPVASSLVMISLGALYGAPAGIALALAGRMGMAAAGFAVGRAGGRLVDRLVSAHERAYADAVLRRWGALAVVVSRPVPLVAETVVIVAGTSSLPWSRFLLAAGLGSLPEAVAYGVAGSLAPSPGSTGMIWGSFAVIAGGFWLLGRRIERRAATAGTPAARPASVAASGLLRDR